jgi:hypothetical protein
MTRVSEFLNDLRITECRRSARDVLKRFHIESPNAIDLETIAWHVGRLRVKSGGLSGAEGRLVATAGHGGVIRAVLTNNEGRWRFTVAHEIGHYVLHQHGTIDRTTRKKDFTVWTRASEEAEANYFAAELLMPEEMFQPACVGVPSIKLLDSLSGTFRTSLLATAFQYWEYTREPVALVLSDGWQMQSFRPFKEGWPRIRFGEIHKHSAAGERLAGKSGDSGKMVRTPAYAWLEGFDYKPDTNIKEDSLYLDYYDRTITLLWIDEPL